MATFLLYWNPYFSSYKLERFLEEFNFPEGKDILFYLDRKRELEEAFFDRRGHNYLWKPGERAKEEQWNKASAEAVKKCDKFIADLEK